MRKNPKKSHFKLSVEWQIKILFGEKGKFCKENNIQPKELSRKINTCENKFKWINTFLKPLNKRVVLIDLEDEIK